MVPRHLESVQALLAPHFRIMKVPGLEDLVLLPEELAQKADRILSTSYLTEVDGQPGLMVDPELIKETFNLTEKQVEEVFARDKERREQES